MRTNLLLTSMVVLCGAAASAQDQATTLAEACRRADVIVRATVVAATDPSPDWHRLQFRVSQRLAGQVGDEFAVLEPSGACCGRSLFALQVGADCLLFLQRRGPTLHPFGGGRGVLEAEPDLVAHVQALLAAPSAAARSALLVAGLRSDRPRVAHDAALALATLADVHLDATGRATVAERLRHAAQNGLATGPALADVAVRSGDDALLADVVATYLDTPRADQAKALRRSLLRATPGRLTQELLPRLDGPATAQVRAVELLTDLPHEHALGPLRQLLQRPGHPRAKLFAVESLLAAGQRAEQLQALVPAAVLELAEQRRAARTKFRSVEPRRR